MNLGSDKPIICPDVQNTIHHYLTSIEQKHQIQIILAVESGSRAWGFPSQDSDYDVRFVYAHTTDWYLSINHQDRRDVIELPLTKVLDINGWDLRKALQLLRKSNPALLEWLRSPVIYRQHCLANQLRQLAANTYNPQSMAYHYLRMAQNNYHQYLSGDRIRPKKYFYGLRPLLALRWIDRWPDQLPPIEFDQLMAATLEDQQLQAEINQLLAAKKHGFEQDTGAPIPLISDFIQRELDHWQQHNKHTTNQLADVELLNQFFRYSLQQLNPY